MPAHIRIQDVINVTANVVQDREDAVDVGMYNYVTVVFQVLKAASAGTVQLEEAAVNEESSYVPLGNAVSLSQVDKIKQVFSSTLRFLRWRVSGINGDATFLIDAVVRE